MKKNWYSITNKSDSECVIDIFDEIGLWGVTSKDFAEQLQSVGKIKNLTLNLDCPGGDCNDGLTIYDAIRACGASVTVNVIGLAASMASVIMLAADAGRIRIYENARVMIHRVTGGAFGNSDDLDAATKLVRQFEDRIVALYVARTGKPDTEIRDMMKAQLGTWFFGQEAVDAGFADSVTTGEKAKAFKAQWAGLFTMLPAALFKEVEKLIDAPENKTTSVDMPEVTKTPAEVELEKIETKKITDAHAKEVKDAAELGATNERQRVTDIKAWAGLVTKAHKIDLTEVTDKFIAEGKSLAEFKDHVTTNTFKAVSLKTATDTSGAQGNALSRSAFNKLTPRAQSDFCRNGGKITEPKLVLYTQEAE